MTTTTPRSPAMPRGRYWHVKACWRALKGLGVGMFVSFYIYIWGAQRALLEAVDNHLRYRLIYYPDAELFAKIGETYPLLAEAWGQSGHETFYDLLVRTLSYEPVLATIFGLLCCTVLLELRERRRQGT